MLTELERELAAALKDALDALHHCAENPAFEDEAPEFNEGGIGREACQKARRALARL